MASISVFIKCILRVVRAEIFAGHADAGTAKSVGIEKFGVVRLRLCLRCAALRCREDRLRPARPTKSQRRARVRAMGPAVS